MGVTFADFPCELPDTIKQACDRQRLPSGRFWGVANKFMCPGGIQPGRGWLLMRRSSIDQINRNALHDLVFTDNSGGMVRIKDLLFRRAWCILPGYTADPLACYLVEVVDVRWLAWNPNWTNVLVNGQYNVRAPAGGDEYYLATTIDSAGTAWTWQQVLDNIWTAIAVPELGAAPMLPSPPTAPPENLRFEAASAWEVYHSILRLLSCQLVFDPTVASDANRCTIAYYGPAPATEGAAGPQAYFAGDQPLLDALAANRQHLILDSDVLQGLRATVPEKIKVLFHYLSDQYGTEAVTTSGNDQFMTDPVNAQSRNNPCKTGDAGETWNLSATIPNPDTVANTQPGSVKFVYDDQPYRLNYAGTAIDAALIQSRADSRAQDYFATLASVKPLHQVYKQFLTDRGFLPGKTLTGVAWYDTGAGPITEIVAFPNGASAEAAGWEERLPQPNEWLGPALLGRAGNPVYPPQVQLVSVGVLTGTPLVYYGSVMHPDPSMGTGRIDEACWIIATNAGGLALGARMLGKLNGYATFEGERRPAYVVGGSSSGESTSIVIEYVGADCVPKTLTLVVVNGAIQSHSIV